MPALNTDEFMEGKTVEYVKLANGVEIPKIGYGVFQISKDDAPRCVREAIETGYRHIDTDSRTSTRPKSAKESRIPVSIVRICSSLPRSGSAITAMRTR